MTHTALHRDRPTPRSLVLAAAVGLSLLATEGGATTLSAFVTGAVESSPEVREQVHIYRQVAQDYQIALAGWRPSLDAAGSYGGVRRNAANTGNTTDTYDAADASLALSQNLFSGFDTTNAVKQARARISSAAYFLYDTADNVALDAVQAYMDALIQRKLVEFAAQNVESHERILAKIQELSDQGITRRSDVEQTEGRLARAKASQIAQQNNLEDALTRLHKLLGRYVSQDQLVDPTNLPERTDAEVEVEDLVNQALVTHPAITSARLNIEAARFDFERSRSTDLPRLDLQLRQEVGNDTDGPSGRVEEGSVRLNLNYNLYRGGADRAEQRKRLSVLHANKSFLDRVYRQVIDALRLSWSAERGLDGQLPFLSQHVEKSLETLLLYREEYLLQRRDLIDVLNAESELNRSLSARAEAFYSSLTARYRVREGIGTLFEAVSLEVDLSDDQFRLAGVDTRGLDGPVLSTDRDEDGVVDSKDQCDNSTGPVNAYGCASTVKLELGYRGLINPIEPQPDQIETELGRPTRIAVSRLLRNDSVDESEDLQRLQLVGFSQPSHGTLAADGKDFLLYTPASGFTGEDSFTYQATDLRGLVGSATVTLLPPGQAPAPARAPAPVPAKMQSQTGAPAAGLPPFIVVRFDYKSLNLTAGSRSDLSALLGKLREDPSIKVDVFAYTDNVGSAGYNRRLSQRRADAMKRYLVDQGIDVSRIRARGMGENDPIADNSTDEGRALNRRGEFHFRVPGAG